MQMKIIDIVLICHALKRFTAFSELTFRKTLKTLLASWVTTVLQSYVRFLYIALSLLSLRFP